MLHQRCGGGEVGEGEVAVPHPGVERVRLGRGGQLGLATGQFQNQLAGTDVPELDAVFQIGVVPATGDVGHVERGGAHQAHLADAANQALEIDEALADGLFVLEEADADNRCRQLRPVTDADRLAVQGGGLARGAGEELVAFGVEHDCGHGLPAGADPLLGGNADGVVGDVVEVVDGAVERVHHPADVSLRVAGDGFFAEDAMVGEVGKDDAGDQGLGLFVEGELDVVVGGEVDVEFGAEVLFQQFPGGVGGFNGGV